jgi:sulfate transport system permease protein
VTFVRRPGFALSTGITLLGTSLMILLPLAALALKAVHARAGTFAAVLGNPRVQTACLFSLGAAFAAALFNLFWGSLLAWVLVRYPFPGRGLADALVDLPFALPTAVAGLTLSSLYGPKGWIGHLLSFPMVYNRLGVVLALSFVSLPFVVRSIQPVLEELPREMEEAAACLGASRWITLRRVVLPALIPALLSGFALSFARAVGEYGSVVFVSGNLPFKTEIAPLLIVVKLEQYDYDGAVALAVIMLVVSLLVLLAIHLLQRRLGRAAHHV